ncbi:nucleolar protein dao-5 isoform X1 [Drosophila navojoa]|uniref:nucleolar protein dao-5 isoform X1 n=1 Tax=Drosophila navojoa TaxID=7232 RepID=UPI0008470149|nr:nucleolar protein dao-5 isoform X1 [Drosophila navojoa]
MKRATRWLIITATVLLLGLLSSADAALPFKKVSIAKTPASTTSTSTTTTTTTPEPVTEKEEPPTAEGEEGKSENGTISKRKLTGIPQIDYVWDPNLPRELRGYNLSTYPFLSSVPPMDEIHFKCEGLHDGFYASIEYKCQIYHHCVYGIRHDFLCANFTAFDQRTFICHFASDVDCEGSQKYWNRNDELYMATTTSSTSTTTTEPPPPPPPPPRRRGQRPYHRPYNRRPVDDYYYDETEDEYYDDRYSRRNPRPRPRKPQLDYDDEYDEKKPLRHNRNRYRDEEDLIDEDYDDRRNRPGGRRGKPAAGAGGRGKAVPRKPGRVDERRSFTEDRDAEEPRRAAGRRRSSDKRPTPSTTAVLDELDEYEKPYDLDQEEAAEEQTPQKVKTTPKPLAEFVTPKAAAASVYARPRAPPRIARPVPINEKKKYSYPVQKSTATPTPASAADEQEDDDYYQDREQQEDDYEEPIQPARSASRRRTAAPKEQKPTRSTLRKPVTDKKTLLDLEEDYAVEQREAPRRKRPQAIRARVPPVDVDFVDDVDYEERPVPVRGRVRTKAGVARKPVARPRQPIVHEEEEELLEPVSEELSEQQRVPPARTKSNSLASLTPARRNQKLALATRQRALPTSTTTAAPAVEEELAEEEPLQAENEEPDEPLAPAAPAKPLRPASIYAGERLSRRRTRVHIDTNTLPEEQ